MKKDQATLIQLAEELELQKKVVTSYNSSLTNNDDYIDGISYGIELSLAIIYAHRLPIQHEKL